MTRVTPRLLLVIGALLLAAWIVAPLSSSPPPQVASHASANEVAAPVVPGLDEINKEVDRLRDRLVEPVRAEAPVRDPFQFATAAVGRFDGRPDTDNEETLVLESAPPAIGWPTLVAILSSGADATPDRRAVFEDASQLIQFRSGGEALGDVLVTDITADSVTLTHASSGASTVITLR